MPAGKTYIKIATQTLASTSTSVTFSNLPQGYTDLVLVFNTRNSRATPNDGLGIRFNDDSGTNYFETRLTSESGGPYYDQFNRSYINSYGTTAANAASNLFGLDVISVMNYSSSNMCKTVLCRGNASGYGSSIGSGVWNSTSPITSINITPGFAGSPYNFSSGSTFTIYGIECAKNPKATGGNRVYTDGTYWYHIFNYSGQFTTNVALTADYLLVAGGGGGARGGGNTRGGGGGGAGGYRYLTSQSIPSSTNYSVIVGAGGTGAPSNGSPTSGSNSSLGSTSSTGGGRAGNAQSARPDSNGSSGGSGGGGTSGSNSSETGFGGSGNAGSYTPVEGYAGGNSTDGGSGGNGGGGGGSSAAGANATGGSPGAGGAGTSNSITGSSVTYAAGGSGATGSGTTAGTSGTTNLGNGGSGGQGGATTVAGGNGGSGIVVVRYPV